MSRAREGLPKLDRLLLGSKVGGDLSTRVGLLSRNRPMFAPGMLLSNRYRLDRPLGEGGMGCVWAATDERMRRPVAVKLLKTPVPGADIDPERASTERKRLLREARAATAVPHPGVVEVLDVNHEGELPFLVMELLEGRSLRQHLDGGGRMSCATACALLAQVASAVGAAHEHGIVHRDLKPANIFLTGKAPVSAETRVKVLDFGIAKVLHRPAGAATDYLTRTGHLLGSPPYMSPEQAFGEEDIDHRTDLWSLGIVLYECLSGVLPTRADNTGQVFKIITRKGIRPIEEVVPGVPPEIAALLGRMLAQEPSGRPADMREVLAVLERHTDEAPPRPLSPLPSDSLQGLVLPDTDSRPASPPSAPAPAPPPPRRRTGPLLAATGVALSFLVAGVWLGLGRQGPDRPPGAAGTAASGGPSALPVNKTDGALPVNKAGAALAANTAPTAGAPAPGPLSAPAASSAAAPASGRPGEPVPGPGAATQPPRPPQPPQATASVDGLNTAPGPAAQPADTGPVAAPPPPQATASVDGLNTAPGAAARPPDTGPVVAPPPASPAPPRDDDGYQPRKNRLSTSLDPGVSAGHRAGAPGER